MHMSLIACMNVRNIQIISSIGRIQDLGNTEIFGDMGEMDEAHYFLVAREDQVSTYHGALGPTVVQNYERTARADPDYFPDGLGKLGPENCGLVGGNGLRKVLA